MEIKNIDHIVRDFLDGNLSKEDRKVFLKLVSKGSTHDNISDIYQNVFEQIDRLTEPEIDLLFTLLENEKKTPLIRLRPILKYASVILVICGVYLFYQLGVGPSHSILSETYSLSADMTTHILPDGSKIMLYGNSSYEVMEFSKFSRTVMLHGSADFVVVPDKKPFYVRTESGYFTKVLGTKFSVREREGTYAVSVEKGRVSVGKRSDLYGVLSKNDSLTVVHDKVNLYSDPLNPLVFENVNLVDVVRSVNQSYGSEIEFAHSFIGEVKCTASFEKELTVVEILDILCEMYGYSYSIKGHKILIQSIKKSTT